MLYLFLTSFIPLLLVTASDGEQKWKVYDPSKTVKISVRSKRNEFGKWVTEFATEGAAEEIANGMVLNISTALKKCDGVDLVNLRGTLEVDFRQQAVAPVELLIDNSQKSLEFAKKAGINVLLSNNFRTSRRINVDRDFIGGQVLTNRPLNNEELFEVKLEKKYPHWAGSIMVGVSNLSPDEFDFSRECDAPRCGVWTFDDAYQKLKVDDRIGVKRNANGTVQIFINGQLNQWFDEVSEPVYGYVNLYGQAEQATIQIV